VRLRESAAKYDAAGRTIKTLEEFQAAMIRDQRQVGELQRLAEERQRKELAEWQAENEQRWKKETLRWDYSIQEQQKINQKLTDRFPPIEKNVALLQREVETLWKLHEQLGSQQLQEAQRLLDLVGKALEARPKAEGR
jgi:small-conductance mechanosensitive channel